jgi:antirestriction protein ArdC
MQDKHIAVTERIVAELERGCAPWVRPWKGSSLPRNAATQHFYRGINVLWLWAVQEGMGYPTSEWVSFRQALQMGGNVRKGEKGTSIFFYRILEREDDANENGVRKIPLLRSYTIFNVAQCEHLPTVEQSEREPIERIADADAFIQAIGADVRHGGSQAYYSPDRDQITLPPIGCFEAAEHYYAVSCHEHAHWAGAKHRLAREFGKRFGDAAYCVEELVVRRVGAIERRGDCLLDSWENPCVPDLLVPEMAETPKGEQDKSMSGKGPNERSHRSLGRVNARRIWRKLDCLNLSPQGVILHDDASMADASYRGNGGQQ